LRRCRRLEGAAEPLGDGRMKQVERTRAARHIQILSLCRCSSGVSRCRMEEMGDAGEGLVDADARIQERMEELEAERRRRAGGTPKIDPEKAREIESLKLARLNLEKQAEGASHPVRKQQIQLAIAEIDKRLGAL